MGDENKPKGRTIDFGNMNWGKRFDWIKSAVMGLKETGVAGLDAREEDIGFRRLSARSDKELKPVDWQKQLSVAHFLWLQNPMAGRILELMADYVVGDGYSFEAPDELVSKVLDKHWFDPDNNWELLQFERYQEFMLFGTWAPRVFVSEHTGHVKIGPIDPSWIADIIGDKEIAGKATHLKIYKNHNRSAEYASGSGGVETFRVISQDNRVNIHDKETGEEAPNKNFGRLHGEIFYFTANKLTFLLQGISDLFRVADWLDAFDQFVFSLLERINFLNAHLYDITLEGAEQKEVNERASYIAMNPPKPGSSRVHNEKEKWEALAPKMNSGEVEQIAKIIKMLILGSFGIPEHWFGEGGDVNKATAAEMGGPMHRKLKRKQAQWSAILSTILQFQIDKAIEAGVLPTKILQGEDVDGKEKGDYRDLSFKIIVPEVSSKDLEAFASSLDKTTTALTNAVAANFITRAKAAGVWTKVAQELGVELETPSEKDIDKMSDDEDDSVEDAMKKEQEDALKGRNGNGAEKPKPAEKIAPEATPKA